MASYDLSYLGNQTPVLYKKVINTDSDTNFIPLLIYDVNEDIQVGDGFYTNIDYDTAWKNAINNYKIPLVTLAGYRGNQTGAVFFDTDIIKTTIVSQDVLGVYVYPDFDHTLMQISFRASASYSSGSGLYLTLIRTPKNKVFILKRMSPNFGGSSEESILPTENSKGIGATSIYFDLGSGSTYTSNTATEQEQAQTLYNEAYEPDPDDPFNGADPSSPNGGDGNFDYNSDDDDIPDLPTGTVADSGFVTLFAPTNEQLKSLASYLWSDAFSLETFKKMFNNPMDCILGLSLVPVNLPHGTAREITVGNLVTTVSCDVCTTQYVYVDCGSIEISSKSFTGSYLDFSPYTQISLYLPFIGTQPLDTDEVMGSKINVVYHIDVLTGAMCCYVKITNTNPVSKKSATHVLYTFMGQCCESVPLSANSWSDTIGSILNAAASIGGVVATAATGGAAAPVAVAMLAGATTSTANAMQSMKPTVNHSGSMGGGGGMMAQRTPKLIMKAPNISKPSKQQNYTGYPVNQTKKISACKGFTIVQAINLSVSGATQNELQEIDTLLRNGVIV